MSRIGKKIINIPEKTSVKFNNNILSVSGEFGVLTRPILNLVKLNFIDNNNLSLEAIDNLKKTKTYHGLIRNLIQNMIEGVTYTFKKILILEGVGYKCHIKDNKIFLNIGFTHLINIEIPENIKLNIESPIKIIISGIDKEAVNSFAAKLYNIRPPEPYKGKGIRYENQKIILKPGKSRK